MAGYRRAGWPAAWSCRRRSRSPIPEGSQVRMVWRQLHPQRAGDAPDRGGADRRWRTSSRSSVYACTPATFRFCSKPLSDDRREGQHSPTTPTRRAWRAADRDAPGGGRRARPGPQTRHGYAPALRLDRERRGRLRPGGGAGLAADRDQLVPDQRRDRQSGRALRDRGRRGAAPITITARTAAPTTCCCAARR